MRTLIRLLVPALLLSVAAPAQPRWPAVGAQQKPWTRWWWMGSAVDNANLTYLLTEYEKAGLGGVEITPIYGVKGEESRFIPFLSPAWIHHLDHTLTEAKRLGLGVDLAQASGWPFGGPWVNSADACRYVTYQTYTLKAGETLTQPVGYVQKPIIRTVGQPIALGKLLDPVSRNPDLQLHAFDQVRFEKPIPLQTLMAYPAQGQPVDLTAKVGPDGRLNWTAPAAGGTWTLYALFMGWHGKQVERAGPGGEGDVIDHFSKTATLHYLHRFDEAFRGRNLSGLRAFFNDSYEVDDAQGEANWSPLLFTEFGKRRGYDLRAHLPALFGRASAEQNERVLSDYRETVSDLLLENYTQTWRNWAKSKGKLIRNQAHGSPANILDLYAITDIPEIEGTDLLRIKFASSAANVTGKPLVSSESATWDNEHFRSTLGDLKRDMDRFLLGGVNHTFYHGTNYSPRGAAWPGWLFYAAVHFNPNNTFWDDFAALNQYVARCQSFLQQGRPANDVLLYLPIYDAYRQPAREGNGPALLQHFDGIEHGFKGLPVEHHAADLLKRGYGFDFISDKQVLGVTAMTGSLRTSGGAIYQTVVVPDARTMPLGTFAHLLKLAEAGATVVVVGKLPDGVNGLDPGGVRQAAFGRLTTQLRLTNGVAGVQQAPVGRGKVLLGGDLGVLLTTAGVRREPMVDGGLQVVRRQHANKRYYFVVNGSEKPYAGWVRMQTAAASVALYNPMTGALGMARRRAGADQTTEVYLQLQPGESIIVETQTKPQTGPSYAYTEPTGAPIALTGRWTITFTKGGPDQPLPLQTDRLASWTDIGDETHRRFSGTATYALTFLRPSGNPQPPSAWLLDLGRVAESARVRLNGRELGTLIGPTFQLTVPAEAIQATNTLEVLVSNGMANRISDMDRKGVVWKRFYNINMSPRLRENRGADGNFTAERWSPQPSGLLGPVTLTPVRFVP